MSLEKYKQDLDEVVEEVFSAVEVEDPVEASVRMRLATIETEDSLERIDEDEVKQAREDVLEKLDETFEELAVERHRLEGNDIERDDLGGTTTEAHIIDGFGELGAEVQKKYSNIRAFMNSTISPDEIAGMTIDAYIPTYSPGADESTPEQLVEHFYDKITGDDMTAQDIDPEDIPEALRDIYTEEE